MSWAAIVDESLAAPAMLQAPAMPEEPAVPGAPARLYVKNLHATTSRENVEELLTPLLTAAPSNVYVSKAQHGRRWAKFDVSPTDAEFLLRYFNLFAGVCNAPASAEYARS